jgi:DNA-binding CsgD family transcriptional regulator
MLTPVSPGRPLPIYRDMAEGPLQRLVTAAEADLPLEPVMAEIVTGFGFDSFLYAMTTVSRPDRESKAYCWTNLPREWVAAYDENAYVEVDPRITQTADRTTPFVWDSATPTRDPKVRGFLRHAAQYGVCSGVACAFCDPSRARMGFMFNSRVTPVSVERMRSIQAQLGTLMLFSAGFHDIFMTRFVQKGYAPIHKGQPLSRRERQCLTSAAKGMTSADIGMKLGITERTANFHFSNILSKLDVLNRKEAIAKAIATGAINTDF